MVLFHGQVDCINNNTIMHNTQICVYYE